MVNLLHRNKSKGTVLNVVNFSTLLPSDFFSSKLQLHPFLNFRLQSISHLLKYDKIMEVRKKSSTFYVCLTEYSVNIHYDFYIISRILNANVDVAEDAQYIV